ncbi:peptidase associated domain and porin domain-containing protein [Paraliomyxa miuraensis]|uniref:carboxypeptidase regulatory-like domain-containing protein n=1 Tax=Paraliomyxa miuraensis TaxID=376150 RepID=UPI00224D7D03|nr:carboxypeptidase regulatory-like domain-containing protein [Paraliomyxa miuraensis]MCX4240940.1 TonB-dependent receptor [Paraliomyxa miuraensis]
MRRARVGAWVLLAAWAWVGLAIAVPAQAAEPPACASREGCGGLRGLVRVAGEREPVEGARVVVVPASHPLDADRPPPWSVGTITDAEGRFSIEGVPAGPVRMVVLREGLLRLEQATEVVRDAVVAVELFPMSDLDHDYRTVVQGERSIQHSEPRSTVLSREEIQTLPGTQGDALRALQNLPGVARPPGGLGLLVLRGAPPWQSLTMLGEHPIPRAFHALPLAAVVQSEALDGIELAPSNAPARYGPLAGGLVRLHPHRPRRDGTHGHAEVDVAGTNASVEGPLGLGSYMVAARRGWLDAVLRGAEKVVEGQGFFLPGLWDYQVWMLQPVVGDGELEIRALGAGDRVRQRYYDRWSTQDVRTVFEVRTQFHRFDLVGRWQVGRTRLLLSPAVRIGTDFASVIDYVTLSRREVVPGWRAELETVIAPRARILVGTDGTIAPFRANAAYIVTDADGLESVLSERNSSGVEASGGVFSIVHFGDERWRLSPGVRVQGFRLNEEHHAAIDPRFDSRIALGDRADLDFGVGRYSQAAITQVSLTGQVVEDLVDDLAPTIILPSALVSSFEPRVPFDGNSLGMRVVSSTQASASVEVELPQQLDLRVGGFVRSFHDPGRVGVHDTELGLSGTATTGLDYGGELLLRRRLTRKLYGWVAYTLMRSRRAVADGTVVPGDFDQPHNLVAVASYRLPRRWRIGGRFRVASGNPYRPVVGVAELDEIGYPTRSTPVFGVDNSARFPVFHQLDLRVDKQWVRPRATITGYLDVQNVYNRQNVEAWIYQRDYRGRIGAFGLPVFPTLGVRVDF